MLLEQPPFFWKGSPQVGEPFLYVLSAQRHRMLKQERASHKAGSTPLSKISTYSAALRFPLNETKKTDRKSACVSTSGHAVYTVCDWKCLFTSAVTYFQVDDISFFSLLQIHPRPQMQKAIRADQRGEVDARWRRHNRLINSHQLKD